MEINEYLEKQQNFDTEESQNSNYDLLVKFVTVWVKDREPEKYAELVSRFKYLEPSIVANQEIASSAETPPDTDSSGYNGPF
tara:strand:- start:50 stop:295 length:246 start_codon:yes stop_codon:yes gene_type:complete